MMSNTDAAPATLQAFAANVLKYAAHAAADRFGDRKTFLCSVLELWFLEDRATVPARADFFAQLYAAHRAQLLVLARADLVSAMDPELVRWSEMAVPGATFHFVATTPAG